MKKSSVPEINAASMADIAFQLLLFFIFATTMSYEAGMMRKLPPFNEVITNAPFNDRDVFVVLVNNENKIMVEGKPMEIRDLRNVAKRFIQNPENEPKLPERIPTKINFFGTIEITKNHVISLQSDRGTLYKTYLAVQNELTAAYNELRNDLSIKSFNITYSELEEDDPRKKAIDEVYPLTISEAEPKLTQL